MSVINSVKNNIKQRIEALSSVQSVYGYERQSPEGWPAVFVMPANLEGEFTSTVENRRTYGFDIAILFPIGQDVTKDDADMQREEHAQEIVADTMEDIINDFDNNYEFPGDGDVLWIAAADAEWGTFDYTGGKAKAVVVTLLMNIDHNVSS